jgi:cell division protein FtsB
MRTTGGPGAGRGATRGASGRPARGTGTSRSGGPSRSGSARSGSARSGSAGASRTGAARAGAAPGRAGGAGGGAPPRGEAPRSASRPAASRRGAPTGATKRTRAPQPRRLTGRATILGLLLLGLLLAYAYPVRVYLSQQAEISQLVEHQDAQRRHIDALAEERQKWNDDEYIKAQARRRLHYVMPGEVPYVVLGGQAVPAQSAPGSAKADAPAAPWYGKLWSSLQAADRSPAAAR